MLRVVGADPFVDEVRNADLGSGGRGVVLRQDQIGQRLRGGEFFGGKQFFPRKLHRLGEIGVLKDMPRRKQRRGRLGVIGRGDGRNRSSTSGTAEKAFQSMAAGNRGQ